MFRFYVSFLLVLLVFPSSLIAQTKGVSYCYEVAYSFGWGQTPNEACAGAQFNTLSYFNKICRDNTTGRCASKGAAIWTGVFDALTSESPKLDVRDWYGDLEFICYIPIVCRYRLGSPEVAD
jgi:hypothetical protein